MEQSRGNAHRSSSSVIDDDGLQAHSPAARQSAYRNRKPYTNVIEKIAGRTGLTAADSIATTTCTITC